MSVGQGAARTRPYCMGWSARVGVVWRVRPQGAHALSRGYARARLHVLQGLWCDPLMDDTFQRIEER
eukprot:3194550-Prymnesium_polylepis.2